MRVRRGRDRVGVWEETWTSEQISRSMYLFNYIPGSVAWNKGRRPGARRSLRVRHGKAARQ